MPGYLLRWESSRAVALASCSSCLGDQGEPTAEARQALVEELEQLSVSPISVVPSMLSLSLPMPSPAHPTPFSFGRVVARQLNLAFGRSKPAQKESGTTKRKFSSYPGGRTNRRGFRCQTKLNVVEA